MVLQRTSKRERRSRSEAPPAAAAGSWTRRAWLAGMAGALLSMGCDRLTHSRAEPDRVQPKGAPFSFRLPASWRVDEVGEFSVRLRVSDDRGEDAASVLLQWSPMLEGRTGPSVSLAPLPGREKVQLAGSGTTTLGTWMARWRTYTYQGKKGRIAQVTWVVYAPRWLIRSELQCPQAELDRLAKRLRQLLESLRIENH